MLSKLLKGIAKVFRGQNTIGLQVDAIKTPIIIERFSDIIRALSIRIIGLIKNTAIHIEIQQILVSFD